MSQKLPPLAAIRVFDAAARLSSFTRAGEELGMSQAAVSYQIKVLEERVGMALFVRKARRVELTEAGAAIAPTVARAFELMGEAFGPVLDRERGNLTISSLHSFAARILVPRLGAFQLAHPQFSVRLDTSNALADFTTDGADVGVRSGLGEWPGLVAHKLIESDYAPMLSPGLAATIGGVREPADLLKLPIVDAHDIWWQNWFRMAGVPSAMEGLAQRPSTRLGVQAFEGEVALAGRGVAILTPAYFRNELADGRLIQPFGIVGRDPMAVWLVYPHSRRNLPKIKVFRDWLLTELAGERILADASSPIVT